MEMQDGGKSHHTAGSHIILWQSQWHSGIQQKNQKVTKSSRDIAHSEIFVDLRKEVCTEYQWHSVCHIAFFQILSIPDPNGTATITQTSLDNLLTIPMAQGLLHRLLLAISSDNPNGTATVTQTSFGNFFWQSQWHSDCYTDFFWQFLLTIPMAQRLLHRLLLSIFFDNPNGTATVTQTSFGNFFWQSQWHSDCYTDFFWQFLLTIPMAQRLLHRLLVAICGAQILLSTCVAKAAPATKHGDRDSFRWRRLVQETLMLLCHCNFFYFSFQVQKPSNS